MAPDTRPDEDVRQTGKGNDMNAIELYVKIVLKPGRKVTPKFKAAAIRWLFITRERRFNEYEY